MEKTYRLTPKGISTIKESFKNAKINPYGVSYNLYCITEEIEKLIPQKRKRETSHIENTLEIQWAIQEMIKRKLF